MLDGEHRARIIDARDHYEDAFRTLIREGSEDGAYRGDVSPKMTSIFILSILNAIERWYRPDGELDRDALVAEISSFARAGLG